MTNVIKASIMTVATILIILLGAGVLLLATFLIINDYYILFGIYSLVLTFIYWLIKFKEDNE